MHQQVLIGPFRQILTMDNLQLKGPLKDEQLEIIQEGGILVEKGQILKTGSFTQLEKEGYTTQLIKNNMVAMPGLIDPHTHITWAGNRSLDYALRLDGKSYVEIANSGGGIWHTVTQTRKASLEDLIQSTIQNAKRHLMDGVTTIEVKSGYGLTIEEEIKMLQAIKEADKKTTSDLIPTCLAAHMCPKDFWGDSNDYLKMLSKELLPILKLKEVTRRVDIFIENSAFSPEEALDYLIDAQRMGFDLVVHADQFTTGGSSIAVKVNALSADHLEASGKEEIKLLAKSDTIPVALPGASIGLADPFTPARKLLDAGTSLAIGSDWNPGSGPMGDLLITASILSMYEKLNTTETLAALTFRAAAALNLKDRGIIKPGYLADIIAFPFKDYRDILYNQGKIKPELIIKNGTTVKQ